MSGISPGGGERGSYQNISAGVHYDDDALIFSDRHNIWNASWSSSVAAVGYIFVWYGGSGSVWAS